MKKFLLGVLKFFAVSAAIVTLAIATVLFIASRASFKIPKDRHILIIGDSHTERAIDDAIFSEAVNVSQGAAAYLYSYAKLRKFIEENQHIDTVLVSFHGGAIPKVRDELIIGDEFIFSKVPIYLFLLRTDELLVFINKPVFYSSIIRTPMGCLRTILNFLIKHTATYKDFNIGGYSRLDRDKLERDIELKEIESAENNGAAENEYSAYQLEYLLKIKDLCEKEGVRLILFNSPTYQPEKYGNLPALADYYNTYFAGTDYLDYSGFPLPDYGYGDIGHLNYKGAELFSRYLEDNYETIFK